MLPASNYPLSRHKMYTRIHEHVCDMKGKVLFVGETGNSGIIKMLPESNDITITDYPETDIMNLYQYNDSVFDLVVSDQVLEHVTKPQLAVDEMYRVVKPGGSVVTTTCLMNPIHYSSEESQDDYWRFTPSGLRVLFSEYTTIKLCEGSGDFKLLFYCMRDMRHKTDLPEFDSIANGDDGKTYIHVYIIAEK